MATTRIKDITSTATSLASDDYVAVDGATNGTRKMVRGSIFTDVASAFTGAPTTYDICPLNSGTGKIDATYLPTSGDTPKGAWDASTNTPTLADGTGAAGDYYDVTVAGTQNLGSVPITFTVGDVVKYNGTVWFKIDSVANFLDGYSTAATSRTALEVNSIDEDAAATGTKLVGPALYFRGAGPNDYIEFADDGRWTFSDGTDDLPFSISAWVNMEDATNFSIASKYGTGSSTREWLLYVDGSDRLTLILHDGTVTTKIVSDAALTGYEGQWIHVVASYAGAGPSAASGAAFTANMSGGNAVLHVNGSPTAATATDNASYAGMSDTSQPVWLGRYSTAYSKGHIKDVKIFNRELTAAEVVLAMNGDLGFADEWGDNVTRNTGTFTNTVSPSSQFGTITGASSSGFTAAYNPANSTNRIGSLLSAATSSRKRYRVTFKANTDGQTVQVWTMSSDSLGGQHQIGSITSATLTRFSYEFVEGSINGGDRIGFLAASPSAGSLVVSDLRFTAIGNLCDLRAENYDESTGKLYDESSNAFVGVNNGATLVGRALPVYEAGTWTPSLYYSGTSAATYSAQSGSYTRIGNTVYVRGSISVSGIGASSGAVSVAGLPFTPSSAGASSSIAGCYITSAANLTSQPIGLVGDGVSQIALYDAGATGNSALDETNITASSVIKVSATYQIQ